MGQRSQIAAANSARPAYGVVPPSGRIAALVYLLNRSFVSAERCKQLRQATDAWHQEVAQAQRRRLERYRSLRRYLFALLEAYSDAEIWLDQWALHLSSLDMASSRQLELLLSQGKTLIGEATAQAGTGAGHGSHYRRGHDRGERRGDPDKYTSPISSHTLRRP